MNDKIIIKTPRLGDITFIVPWGRDNLISPEPLGSGDI